MGRNNTNIYKLLVCLIWGTGTLAILHTQMGACTETDEYCHNMNSPGDKAGFLAYLLHYVGR